ncbi:hypothetical protein [Pelagicoccus albus]|uniref:Uncharacterized protein n=1 Tax=Pelagicoccus albus TaxID=415222 RepID=A0A7X1B5G9_9BACT|nr:hypothetical protein [Pelagicoccus albus]MBC2605996.1 hypothetical protein [Pelagicoccus albus]
MNKTLLLILCDFLLLTILSMWKMEEDAPPPTEAEVAESQEASVSGMAMMEQDLLDTLAYSLEEEQAQRSELSEDLEAKAAELAKREEELAQRQDRIQSLEQNLSEAEQRQQQLAEERQNLEQEAQALQNQVEEARSEAQSVTQRLSEAEQQALQSQAQSRLLQEELDRKLEEIEAKESALQAKDQQLANTQQQVQELGVQVRMREQENEFLQDSVTDLKGAVVAEREERERLQEQSTFLAQGVSELAASSQDLTQELRSNFEINANQLFADFKNNQVNANFTAIKLLRNRYVQEEDTTTTVVVSDGTDYYALVHIDNMPFGLRSNPSYVRSVSLTLSRSGADKRVGALGFMDLDPRIAMIKLTAEEASSLGGKPYLTALEPFKFPEAVLVDHDGKYYGEVEFKLDSETPGFVKMQTKIFSSIFGEFSPSTGDLVLSKTGELLGIMVNRRYCVLVNNFVALETLDLRRQLNTGELKGTLRVLNSALDDFPSPLR